MPVVRTIYGASKQILETIISSQSDAFREVVLVEYPRKGCGLSALSLAEPRGRCATFVDSDMVNVFVPTTPNPTSGFLLFCPRSEVIFVQMSVEEAVKLVVSGGIVTPPDAGKASIARKSANTAKKAGTKKTTAKKTTAKKALAKKAGTRKTTAKKASTAG